MQTGSGHRVPMKLMAAALRQLCTRHYPPILACEPDLGSAVPIAWCGALAAAASALLVALTFGASDRVRCGTHAILILTSLVRRGRMNRSRVRKQWQLQEAKAHFSELFRLARESGPQRVTKHGREAVIVIPAEEYERLSSSKGRQGSLVQFFAESPLAGSEIVFERPRDFGRDIKL